MDRSFFKKPVLKTADPLIFYPLLISGVLILAQIMILAAYISTLPPQIPFFYSRPWGEEQLANPLFLWLIPTGSIVIVGLNSLFLFLAGKRFIAKRLLVGFSLFCVLSATITFVRIILLVS